MLLTRAHISARGGLHSRASRTNNQATRAQGYARLGLPHCLAARPTGACTRSLHTLASSPRAPPPRLCVPARGNGRPRCAALVLELGNLGLMLGRRRRLLLADPVRNPASAHRGGGASKARQRALGSAPWARLLVARRRALLAASALLLVLGVPDRALFLPHPRRCVSNTPGLHTRSRRCAALAMFVFGFFLMAANCCGGRQLES